VASLASTSVAVRLHYFLPPDHGDFGPCGFGGLRIEGLEHIVYAGGRGAEETFRIALSWGLAMDRHVCVDECQVLALPVCPLNGVVICRGHRHEKGKHVGRWSSWPMKWCA
jgi:hypothetical protein